MSSEVNIKHLKINKLTEAQYQAATKSDTELYLTPDTTDQDIADAVSTHNSSASAHTNLVRRKSTTAATGGANQGVYVDANGQVQTCNATTSTYSSTGTTAVNGTAVASALESYIPKNFGGRVANLGVRVDAIKYGTTDRPKGYFTNFNLLHAVENKLYYIDRGLKTGTPATITSTCSKLGSNMFNGGFSGYWTDVNPSTDFTVENPLIFEMKVPVSLGYSNTGNLLLLGHRLTGSLKATKYKLEVAYAYSKGTYTWGTIIDYDGAAVELLNKHYDLYYSAHGGEYTYHSVYGFRLTVSGSTSTVLQLAEIMWLYSWGDERVPRALNTIDIGSGGKVTGDITIPTEYGSFIGNLTGTATNATKDGSGNTITSTYVPNTRKINNKALSSDITLTASDVGAISSHQSIKTLNTNNTTAQTASASEDIAGSGTINLHKIAKTGTFSDLLSKPTSISGYGITDAYTKTEVDGMISDVTSTLLDLLYPVGAVYIGTMASCPLATLGIGTWEKVSEGRVLQGSDTNHAAGTTIEAGLPNIKGRWGSFAPGNYQNGVSGAVTTDIALISNIPGGTSDTRYGFAFNASRYNSIYSDSVSTVQPPAFVVNIWRRTA